MKAVDKVKGSAIATIFAAVFTLFSAQTVSAGNLPRIQFVTGDVQLIDLDGNKRPIIKGEVLLPGEKLITGEGAMVQLRVFKQAIVALRESSEIKLMPAIGGRFDIALEQGLIRTVTALAGESAAININTPGAVIHVAAGDGDNQTGVGLLKKGSKVTYNQVLTGHVKIKAGAIETVARVGAVLKIGPYGKGIKKLDKAPISMRLSVATISPNKAGKTKKTSQPVVKVKTQALVTASKNVKGLKGASVKPKVGVRKTGPALKANYDGVKVLNPTMDGAGDNADAINNTLIVSLRSPTSKAETFVPVKTADSKIRASLTKKAEIIKLVPTGKTAGEQVILSSPKVPNIRIIAFPDTQKDKVKQISNINNTVKCILCNNTNVTIIKTPKTKRK